MKKKRFQIACLFLCLGFLIEITIAIDKADSREKFPSRPVEIIVGLSQGGGTDLIVRIFAEAVTPFLGQKMVVINKPGAGGVIGVNAVTIAKPDGYTIGGVNPGALTIIPHSRKVDFTLDDFSYLSQLSTAPVVFCCNADFPFKNAKDFFAYAQKHPGKFTYGCDGIGGALFFKAEAIFRAMNVKLRPVPFGGAGESMKALLGRHVDLYGGSFPPALPHVKAGTIRGLFASSLEDAQEIPGAVGLSTLGHPEAAMLSWKGAVAPKGLSEERRLILERAFEKAAQSEIVRKRIGEMGEKVVGSTGKKFEEIVRSEFSANATLSKEFGLQKK